ncbi:hypothetical protein COMA1_30396 [Candidatus Nitrospira nitrosa]|uniref:Uncharacterized protein n=1 Tax=Candidatus Nitrospira nitrosa TaxID=1742972 RepID=A0A0S4LHV1_9BACT|nr:hypothetical protein COMA1_30396 [Candidatus Nitrospira nitrosa]
MIAGRPKSDETRTMRTQFDAGKVQIAPKASRYIFTFPQQQPTLQHFLHD